eukprot:CAMPEP_0172527316 /NCGR_PEP_ID=MMETSP1067-20121228/2038_1 /TAXON_ID=265564 ORGANISM="Thalassiosira punctigera, Strain Tpunct2005C2" /NCGR_SAMPLE_ID=MMETSP1067 /ASSEMBLY_ACC=CAM_ASM_000444 /LENGTH=294 /DNA_ID=CAMNT_0013311037 /DNA_START=41 /DNA_END=925 /DNA_ORIENTATION=-
MTRSVTALALVLAAASSATAFTPGRGAPARAVATSLKSTPFFASEDDFDAPVLADPQAGTAVLESEPVVDDECYMGKDGDFGGCVDFDPFKRPTRSVNAMDSKRSAPRWAYGDDFDAPVPINPQMGTAVLESQPIVDDECYMGKDGDLGECADFDPITRPTRSVNAMDSSRPVPGWTYADDFDAPVPANPQVGTTVLESEPVVDDECYMGKNMDFGGCVDFDPPVKPKRTRSANAMDSARTAPRWAFGDDFDAPVLANPQMGTAVLESQPIVDDECYMGKNADFGDCVDFDPPV